MATIDALPTEIFRHIFSFLDSSPPPSETRLHDQPKPDMLRSSETTLKNVSLVCRPWRAIVLPILFRHVVWTFDRWDLLVVEPGQNLDPVASLPFLRFLLDNDLGRHVDSLTMIVGNSMKGMTRRAELGRILEYADSDRSGSGSLFNGISRSPQILNRAATYNGDNNWVWELLFSMMDPRRITIMASPQMLASLLSRMLFLGDAWSFSRDLLHILSLSRETRAKGGVLRAQEAAAELKANAAFSSSSSSSKQSALGASDNPRPGHSKTKYNTPSALFSIRPWTHLLLNEGSSTRVYRTYEFFLRRPPSILGALLGCEEYPNDTPLVPPTLTSLSYVAIFPLSSHFNSLVAFLPPVERLFIQLVPRNDILRDPNEMRNLQPADLWMERNSCYSIVMRELLVGDTDEDDGVDEGDDDPLRPRRQSNWKHLRVFESGDAADKDAWEMAVQYVRMSRTNWRVERDGVFVRGPAPEGSAADGQTQNDENSDGSDTPSLPAGSQSADGHHVDIFQGRLERIMFNGTAHLPHSPLNYTMEDELLAAATTTAPMAGFGALGHMSWAYGAMDDNDEWFDAAGVAFPPWLDPRDDWRGI
ncbi:hypothetical protein QBC47DRAFT_377573 [Echria macrotheca]|uniref:F-box domain-containing protein n=1 Tax=Echria macrotheca TaxID=438768 RepID=A0AAJ0BH66_9PEZI|nr:hypothetical protein QBC47DRAFT_377573 [Echria macrotheca]